MHRSYLSLLTSLILVFSIVSCSKKEVVEEILRPVRYERVSLAGTNTERSFSGTASAGVESKLSFKVNGTLSKRKVHVGDRVKKGQLIAELDATDYNIQEQEIAASLAQAKAQVRNAKANYDRIRALYENDSVSKSDLDASRAAFDSDKAALAALERKLDLASKKIEYTRLLAPIDGVVGKVFVEVNENVNTGDTIVLLESEGDIKVTVGVPESYISSIKTGTHVRVQFSALGSKPFKATVSEVSYSLAEASTYPVSVVLAGSSKDVRPGMTADVYFKFGSSLASSTSIIVPSNSVAEDTEGKFVYVVKQLDQNTATVHRRIVKINKLTNQGFEIKSGLKNGDLIVTAGISKLTDGMKVKFTQ